MAMDYFNFPPLPMPPGTYRPDFIKQFLRTLEVYFSQLDSDTPQHCEKYTADAFYGSDFYGGLFHGSGVYLGTPYGSFTSDTTQTIASITIAAPVNYDLQVFGSGVTYDGTSRISADSDGIYRISYSLQLSNPATEVNIVDVWIRKNGLDAPDSNRRFGIPQRKNATIFGSLIAEASYLGRLHVGDYVEVMWNVADLTVNMPYTAAVAASGTTPAVPATPAAVVQLAFLSKE